MGSQGLRSIVESKTEGASWQTKAARRHRFESSSAWIVAAVSTCLAYWSLTPTMAPAQPSTQDSFKYGYYYKGEFVSLAPSSGLVAISEVGTAFSSFASAQGLVRDPLSDRRQLEGRSLALYRRTPPTLKTDTVSTLGPLMVTFAQTTGEEIQPVFEQGQVLLIPSDELIVGLTEASTLSEAQRFFSPVEDSVGILEIEELRTDTFLLRIDSPSNGRVYQVCQFLAAEDGVEFAEPNHIVVRLDSPITPSMPPGVGQSLDTGEEGNGGSSMGMSSVGWTDLAKEDFETPTLPPGWSTGRANNTVADASWSITSHRRHSGTRSAYATGGGTDGVSAPGDYPNNSFSILDTPTLNLASYEEVFIELWFYAKYEDTNATFCMVPDMGAVGIFDPSSNATTFLRPLAICPTGDLTSDPTTDSGWRRALIRVPPNLRLNGVNVRFVFQSDGTVAEEGLYVDEVRIVGATDVDVDALGNDTYGGRLYEMRNSGQIAGLGDDANDMHVPEAWNVVSVSSNVVVAVIDSGVDLGHNDLNLVQGYDPNGAIGGGHRGNHGTAVAGNVGAIRDNSIGVIGTAPGVKIMPVYSGATNAERAAAIDVAVAEGADVLSNSWGWVGAPSTVIESAIDDALDAGRVVVFAAGNGPDRPPWTYDVAFPGNLNASTDVITVGASSPTDEHKAAASSDGSFSWGSSYVGSGVDIVAPSPWSYTTDISGAAGYHDGSMIDPTDAASADYTPTFGGTSSSTPKVAGIVALLLSVNANLTPLQVKEILRETADDIDAPGVDAKTGAGRVNAFRAVVPSVKISVSRRTVRKNQPFDVTVSASAPFGLEAVWWFGQGTGIAAIDQAHWQNVPGGDHVYAHTWSGVTINQKGTYTLGANARDLLYPNPGDGFPHQASEGSGLATTQIRVTPTGSVLGIVLLFATFALSGWISSGQRRRLLT